MSDISRKPDEAAAEGPLRPISIHRAAGGHDTLSTPVIWRVRVAETGRVFEVPVFEKTEYHKFINILMVLPGVPSAVQDVMFLVGPSPFRLLTSKKFLSIVQSGEHGNVFLYNVSSQRLKVSPTAEPTDRSNKRADYILAASVSAVERVRRDMLEQEVQISSINTLLVYAESSLDSFYKSFFGPVDEKLRTYRDEIDQFDKLLSDLENTPLHPSLAAIDAQRAAEGLGSSGGSIGGVSRGSIGSGTSSPAGSRGNTPRGPADESSGVPVLDVPGVGAPPGPESSVNHVAALRNPRQTLLDCINADSWKIKRNLFLASCDEIQSRLNGLLAEYSKIAQTIPKPFVLQNVHLNVTALYRITALLRNITKQSTSPSGRHQSPGGFIYAGPSPMATGFSEMSAAQTLREILRQVEREAPGADNVSHVLDSPASLYATAAVNDLLLVSVPTSSMDREGSSDSDQTDVVSVYVAMERTLQQQIHDAQRLGSSGGAVLGGPIFLPDLVGIGSASDVGEIPPEEHDASAADQEIRDDAVAAATDEMLRRRYRLDQMVKAVDFFKERVSDEVLRVGKIIRDLKVNLKQLEKTESIRFLKMWKDGKNEHSATLTFLQKYPTAYESYLSEVSRIKRFNELFRAKIDELRKMQLDEFNARKLFWESSMRFLPPLFLDLVPAVRRAPPMLVGPGVIPGLDDLLPDVTEKDEQEDLSHVKETSEHVEIADISDDLHNKMASDVDGTVDNRKIEDLELKLAEREKELELLKMELKNNVRHENQLRNLQHLVQPLDLDSLKAYLASRISIGTTSGSIEETPGKSDDAPSTSSDVPTPEYICRAIIDGMETEVSDRLLEMQRILSSNAYFKNSLNYKAQEHRVDLNKLWQQHGEALESTVEQSAKIVQFQSQIIESQLYDSKK